MQINNQRPDLDLQSHSHRTSTLFDFPHSSHPQNQSFLSKFRHNQGQLKHKFLQYITRQKFRYPLTNKHIKTEPFSQEEEEHYQELDFREVRREKKRLTEQLQTSMNQSKYLQKKKADNEKTFYSLKDKWERVSTVRKERQLQVKQVMNTLKQIQSQIRQEKLKYRRSIEESRFNLTRSRIACENQKHQHAQQTRLQSQQQMQRLTREKEQERQRKKECCETVREKEKYIQLTVSQLKEYKKEQAEEVKLERLLRELAEKEEIKLASSRVQQQMQTKYGQLQHTNHELCTKIKKYRRSLGDRRPSPQPKIRLRLSHKPDDFQEQIERSSTNCGFPISSHKRSFTEQIQTEY